MHRYVQPAHVTFHCAEQITQPLLIICFLSKPADGRRNLPPQFRRMYFANHENNNQCLSRFSSYLFDRLYRFAKISISNNMGPSLDSTPPALLATSALNYPSSATVVIVSVDCFIQASHADLHLFDSYPWRSKKSIIPAVTWRNSHSFKFLRFNQPPIG